jgi:hypothetical protein
MENVVQGGTVKTSKQFPAVYTCKSFEIRIIHGLKIGITVLVV